MRIAAEECREIKEIRIMATGVHHPHRTRAVVRQEEERKQVASSSIEGSGTRQRPEEGLSTLDHEGGRRSFQAFEGEDGERLTQNIGSMQEHDLVNGAGHREWSL